MSDSPNGVKWMRGLVVGLALSVGLIVGAASAGVYLGGINSTLDSHIGSTEIHQTRQQKEHIAREVIDREVQPMLRRMQQQLDRIEGKLDEANK